MKTTPPTPLGSQEKSALESSYFLLGVVGPSGHALALTPSRGRDESGTPSLQRLLAAFPGTTSPSASLSARPHFTFRLIGTVPAQRGLPSRASPVPHQTFAACRLPYPESVLRASGLTRAVSCLHPDMTGSATPPFGSYLTRLQSSRLRIAAHNFAPLLKTLRPPKGFRRSAQTPRISPQRPEPATRRTGSLTAAGLSPAGLIQHHDRLPPRPRSGRTTAMILRPEGRGDLFVLRSTTSSPRDCPALSRRCPASCHASADVGKPARAGPIRRMALRGSGRLRPVPRQRRLGLTG